MAMARKLLAEKQKQQSEKAAKTEKNESDSAWQRKTSCKAAAAEEINDINSAL